MSRTTPAALWNRLYRADALLTATGTVLVAALGATLVGLWLDPRTIAGAPAWLKPAKFVASGAIYCFTLAWILGWLPEWPRLRRFASRVTAGVFVLEVGLVALQAARGTTSHFNMATLFDMVVFNVMGAAIVLQTVTMIPVVVALWKQRFTDEALGWALRLGLLIGIVGSFAGGLMTRPTPDQLDELQRTGRMTVSGAHTVGAPDGGPGLPVTGWSRTHGDLRIAHFVGLHAMQILPAFALLPVVRRRQSRERARLVLVAAASYAALFLLLLAQALRGQPLVAPDALTLGLAAVWMMGTVALGALALRASRRGRTSLSGSPDIRRSSLPRRGPAVP